MKGEAIAHDLASNGWCYLKPFEAVVPARIIETLGPLMFRNNGEVYCDLIPYNKEVAPPSSMSAITGTKAQPRHTDAAFLPLPPRYIVLQCLQVGEGRCPTLLWPLQMARLRGDRPSILTNSKWVARGGGGSPFYCSVLERHRTEMRVRFDPLCMQLLPGSSWSLEQVERTLDDYTRSLEVEWEQGALLVIDNWTCLHARGDGSATAPSRKLRRWNVGVADGLGF